MVQVMVATVFAGAFGVSVATIVAMVAPQWERILHLASGRVEESFAPLQQLVQAERRIAVRRWAASAPVPVRSLGRSIRSWREAA